MAQISQETCRRLARARRDKGMTQSALAQAVGCQQSAISMLEAGQPTKIAQETVEKIAALLEVALAPDEQVTAGASNADWGMLAQAICFCPNAQCYSNLPYLIGTELLFWPRASAHRDEKRCLICGEMLEQSCPHCAQAVHQRAACCNACGGALVINTVLPEGTPQEWVVQRRQEIKEWLEMI